MGKKKPNLEQIFLYIQYMSVTFLFTLFHRYYEDSWWVCTSCVVLYNIASLGPIWGMRLFEISQHVTYNAYRSSPPTPPNPQLWSTLILHPTFVSLITLVHIYVYRTATDVLWRHLEDGTRVRVSKHSGRIIPIPINEEQKTEGDNIAVNSYVGKAHQLHMGK